jgi:guanosine-3',5'-bis(diphosphate) 3'-pyrophosphohydrolase
MEKIEKCKYLAIARHAGQCRPNQSRELKINHIEEVVQLVEQSGGNQDEVAVAWLHDIVEDTDTTTDEIEELFGHEIAQLVDGLTDPPEFSSLPLDVRKLQQAQRLLSKSKGVMRVKLCDQISNIRSVINDPPLDWDNKKCLEYIDGAKKIADVCYGVSDYLDTLFKEAYQKKYKYLVQ